MRVLVLRVFCTDSMYERFDGFLGNVCVGVCVCECVSLVFLMLCIRNLGSEHENGRVHKQSVLLLVDFFGTLVQRVVNQLWFAGCDL